MNAKIEALLKTAAAKMEVLDFGTAIDSYNKVLKLVPTNAPALMGLAIAYNRIGRAPDALPLLNRLWGNASSTKGAAGKTFKAAVLAQIGFARQHMGQFKLAHEAYESANQLAPSAELQTRLAVLAPHVTEADPIMQLIAHAKQLEATSQFEKAIKIYRAALGLNPEHVAVLQGLAWVLRQVGQLDEALPMLQKAIILAPKNPQLFNDMGVLYQDRLENSKAISFYKRALTVDPDFTPAFVNLGVAQKREGRISEAIMAYQTALEIDEHIPEAHNNLGNLLRIKGEFEQAKIHLERAIQLKPGYPDAIANLTELTENTKIRGPSQAPVFEAKLVNKVDSEKVKNDHRQHKTTEKTVRVANRQGQIHNEQNYKKAK